MGGSSIPSTCNCASQTFKLAASFTMLPPKAMKAMKAMKTTTAMKAAGPKAMTVSTAYRTVSETTGVKARDVKGALEAYVGLVATQVKKNGAFKLGGALNLKLKKTPARPARKGVNPFTKEPCVFKAKPASKTVKALALKKLKDMIN